MKKIDTPYSKELLLYCEQPVRILEDDTFAVALKKLVSNHGIYKHCYDIQKGLVDAVKRHQK